MKNKEKEEQVDFTLDADALKEQVEGTSTPIIQQPVSETPVRKMREIDYGEEPLINCLREETIEVRFIPQPGTISDPKHVMYGGMSENSKITICNGKSIRLVGDTPNIEATNDDIAIGISIVNI